MDLLMSSKIFSTDVQKPSYLRRESTAGLTDFKTIISTRPSEETIGEHFIRSTSADNPASVDHSPVPN
jgi:hypothetical protein